MNSPIFLTPIKSSYIDQSDLNELLELYYDGLLDDVEPYINRVNLELSELHPSNTLFGYVDNSEMESLLSKLPLMQQWVLHYHYTNDAEAYKTITHYWFNDTTANFQEWLNDTISLARMTLAVQVMILL